MKAVIEMLSYPFLVRAFIAGILISLCAALLGVSLVLRRCSMIGDGLSHVGFGALAVATACSAAPLAVSIPVVILAAFILLRISESKKISGDSAVALISTGSLAVGVMALSLSSGSNIDVSSYMFGSILAMSSSDLILSIILSVIVLTVYFFFYSHIFAVTFDESFAHATGIRTGICNTAIALLTALTIVVGMRLMGALLISALIIFPSLTSMRVFRSFRSVVISSAVTAVVSFIAGMTVSYVSETPAGASIVCCDILLFALFAAVGKLRSLGK